MTHRCQKAHFTLLRSLRISRRAAHPPGAFAQTLDDLLGSILRIDPSVQPNGAPYGIPPDNPFVGVAGARPEIWAYGVCNPWRFDINPANGDLCSGAIRSMLYADGHVIDDAPVGPFLGQVTAFGEDGLGRIYASSLADRSLYRLDPVTSQRGR